MNEQIKKAVEFAIDAGYQLNSDAFALLETLSKSEDPVVLIEETIRELDNLAQKPLFIDRAFLEDFITCKTKKRAELTTDPLSESPIESSKGLFKPYAKEIDSDIKVLEDPTHSLCTNGSMEEYHKYFLDRFSRLEKLLRRRIDAKGAISISAALKASANSKVKIIGMLTEKRESKERTFLRLEDHEASVTVLAHSNLDSSVRGRVQALLLDQVVCVSVTKTRNDLLILEDVFFPEIPQKKPPEVSCEVYAALISDLHIGSRNFMREEFNRFVSWLNGKFGNSTWREIASHVKYVVIAGDIVDGIGVYPEQIKDLALPDIHSQYRMASKLLEQIPHYVELIIIPGNHDASRGSLPQPAIPRDYAEPIYESRRVKSLGNPSTISLHGVELLLYHGRSLDDVIVNTPSSSFRAPEKAMKLLLQGRHLAPIYGQRTPIAAEPRDLLVIDRVPDVFHAGHVHVQAHDRYRGTLIVNSGAWQRQTEYQSKLGLEPTPGIIPVVNLQTLQVTTLSFTTEETWT